MRAAKEINTNIDSIRVAMEIINNQLEIIEEVYQKNYKAVFDSPSDLMTGMSQALINAREELNSLLHMELNSLEE